MRSVFSNKINFKYPNSCTIPTKSLIFFLGVNKVRFFNKFYLYLPNTWKYCFLKSQVNFPNLLYLYTPVYFFKFVLPSKSFICQRSINLNTIEIFVPVWVNYFTLYLFFCKNILYSFTLLFFTKIKFTGKGYRVFVGSRQTVNFQFGYSHKNYQYLFSLSLKFKNKYFLIIYGMNFFNFNRSIHLFKSIKPINIFTGRGIRFIQDIIYKKPGKISSYR